jgi:hypothetical protein
LARRDRLVPVAAALVVPDRRGLRGHAEKPVHVVKRGRGVRMGLVRVVKPVQRVLRVLRGLLGQLVKPVRRELLEQLV